MTIFLWIIFSLLVFGLILATISAWFFTGNIAVGIGILTIVFCGVFYIIKELC